MRLGEGIEEMAQENAFASDIVQHSAGYVQELLAERLAFERMLADLSATFTNLPSERVEEEIEHGLLRLVEFLGFDRSSFSEFMPDGGINVLCSAAVNGYQPYPRGTFPDTFAWFGSELRAGRTIVMPSLPDDLPPEAAAERRYCIETGFRSHLSIPLRVGGSIISIISFGAFRSTRVWPEDLIARLKIVGEVFAHAFARARADAKLAAAMAEIKQLKERLEAENSYLRHVAQGRIQVGDLASQSAQFKSVLEEVQQVAGTNSAVLLLGETGTGKDLLASALHELSRRKARAMVKINCAALPPTLIEAELFGREKGAYTGALTRQIGRFELADGSTIFLDEIGELPLELQPKLLRVLEEGTFERLGSTQTIKVDVRVIAATNRDLAKAINEGRFREDLYYRLNVFPITVPPLRERREDIPMLVWGFVKEFSESMGKPIERIARDSMEALQSYPWPGNVRELRNVIERAMILARGTTLHISLGKAPALVSVDLTLAEAERRHIAQVLEKCGWRVRGGSGAATVLEVKPTTLEARMKKLGVRRPA
jgi:transcriptional regulator with GAF, ATPase, and Fis domain